MTLIFTQMGERAVVQSTDRLVSRLQANSVQRYDPRSNKNLLYLATNGVAAIAYTGLSYIGQKTTDQWLAEQLGGQPLESTPRGTPPAFTIQYPTPHWLSLGEAFQLLAQKLTEAAQTVEKHQLARAPISVITAGWMWYRRKRPRPFACYLHQTPGGLYTCKWGPRHMGTKYMLNTCPAGYLSAEERRILTLSLRDKDHLAVERAFISKIQEVSQRAPGVGGDCLSITLSPPRFRQAIVRYTARYPTAESVEIGEHRFEATPAYTPWILTPGITEAPSVFGGPGPVSKALGPYQLDWRRQPRLLDQTPVGWSTSNRASSADRVLSLLVRRWFLIETGGPR